jgi:UDP-glucose 4-epimerase
MASFLITGGCGFIGSHLARDLIRDGHAVRVLDDLSGGSPERLPPSCKVLVGDVRDRAMVVDAMGGVDGCFHLAAVTSTQRVNEDWPGTHRTNLGGAVNVLDAARGMRTPVVYASSAAVYGDNAEIPVKETSSVRPLSAYGADKLGTELHARVAGLVYGVPTKGLRLFNVYGPEQDPDSPYSGVISVFVDRLLRGKAVTIFGDGQQTRDFIYVDDAVRALRAAMGKTDCHAGVLNVCRGEPVSINQLAQMLMSILGVRLPVERQVSRSREIRVSVGDPCHARHSLGFKAERTLAEGLRLLIEHERSRAPSGAVAEVRGSQPASQSCFLR